MPDLERIYERLFAWAAGRGFAGSDPFDGLNSELMQATPLRKFRLPRLVLTQAVKRSPVDLRHVLRIPAGVNPKGIALFALAELSRFRTTGDLTHQKNARSLLDRLLDLGIRTEATLAFGYNFDWQSRVFFIPTGTPTIVPTAFASQAFNEAAESLGNDRYAEAVQQIARFAATKLNRPVETESEICFSYTPLDTSCIYNASLLAAECLMRSEDPDHKLLALKAVNHAIQEQREDGAWVYGDGSSQAWVDNFHTAYVIQSLRRIGDELGWTDPAYHAYEKGVRYWLWNFFLENGTPKYYDDSTNPIDIHSAAVAISTLAEINEVDMAKKVAAWTCRNMLDTDGFFYYRIHGALVDETPHMRWGQAWMAYALARLIEYTSPVRN